MVYARLTISINQTHCRAVYLMNHWKAAGLKTNNEDEEIGQKRRQWLVFLPKQPAPFVVDDLKKLFRFSMAIQCSLHCHQFPFHLSNLSSLQGGALYPMNCAGRPCIQKAMQYFEKIWWLLIIAKLLIRDYSNSAWQPRALVSVSAVSVSFELTMNQGPSQRLATIWCNWPTFIHKKKQ